ncbi:MAG TPA: hypothetical protein VFM46_10710, partial [Pseudomonadales bacterium]|nr:hypothetical protein [Pseudomonadales bacterium]
MFKSAPYYLAVSKNSFEITDLISGEKTYKVAEKPFSTQRLLVGDFAAAEASLGALLKQIKAPPFRALIVHPLEMNEGGLSIVEKRVLTEMALGAGASTVVIHEGARLSKEESLSLIKNNAKSTQRAG